MPKILLEPTERIHLMLYSRDLELLRRSFGDNPGVGPAIRDIVRQFTKRLQARLEAAGLTPVPDFDDEELEELLTTTPE